jgi:hypothetical protein
MGRPSMDWCSAEPFTGAVYLPGDSVGYFRRAQTHGSHQRQYDRSIEEPLIIAGLMIVACIFIMLGLIAFCIGILFTMPFIYSVYYILYADIIGNQNEQPASHSDNAPEEY